MSGQTSRPNLTFDSFVLAAVASELRRLTVGAYVQKVQQPSPTDVILSLYGRAGAQRLLLSADPRTFRIHLTQVRRENPITPPGFCQVCRKYLEGTTLASIEMPRFDRLLNLVFQAPDGERMSLAVELLGRNTNVILHSGSGIVRGALRPAPAGTERPLRPGVTYTLPPGSRNNVDSLTVVSPTDPIFDDCPSDPNEAAKWLTTTFTGINRFAAEEIMVRADGDSSAVPAAFVALMEDVRAENFVPVSVATDDGSATAGVWAFPPVSIPPGLRFERESMSVALDTFYATLLELTSEENERTVLTKSLDREISFRRKELASAQATLAEAERADEYEQNGNNLLAHLQMIRKGQENIRLPNLFSDDGGTVAIDLDPTMTPHENAERWFTRARKARDAADYAADRAEGVAEELAELEELQATLGHADDSDAVDAVRAALTRIVGEARAAGASSKPKEAKAKPKEKPYGGHRIRTFTVDGYDLLIGESADANDYLTTRVAGPSDLWMHVRAAPGAHGILRTNGKPERMPESVIRKAASIVAARSSSSVKHASVVAVDIVEKRHVRKPRGAKAGQVQYSRERVLDVEPSQA
ncbi:MAG: NFACT RNA binding domain-containing protein [Armatimonadota bacterium]